MPLYLYNGGLLLVDGALAADANCCCGPVEEECPKCCWPDEAPDKIYGKIIGATGDCSCLLNFEFEMDNTSGTPPINCNPVFHYDFPTNTPSGSCNLQGEVFEIACDEIDGWYFATIIYGPGGPPPAKWTYFEADSCDPFYAEVTGVLLTGFCTGSLTIALAENAADLP